MKVGDKGLKMSSGEVKQFGSQEKRDNFERVAGAYRHGWRPTGDTIGRNGKRTGHKGRKGKRCKKA